MPKAAIAIGGRTDRRYNEQQWQMLIMNGLRKKIFEDKVLMKDISARTNLCISTIGKIMRGETKFPRHHTVITLLKYLGYKLYAEL